MEAVLVSRAVVTLVSKLNTLITEGKNLRQEVKDDLNFIKDEMELMNKTVEKHAESKELRWWVLQVQELAYDMEDTIDISAGKVTCPSRAGWLSKTSHVVKNKGAIDKFTREIQSLRRRVKEVFERRDAYLANGPAPAPDPHPGPSLTDTYIPEEKLVGIAEPKQQLLELLVGEPEKLSVISIVGCRGSGKTTLARVLYDSHRRTAHGDKAVKVNLHDACHAWVVASECQDARDLLAHILSKLRGEDKDTTSPLLELSTQFREHLQGKPKYLIVIDDMMSKKVWQDIQPSFPDEINGRIIVTTSIQSIAKACGSDGGYVYRMQSLDMDSSKKLLLQKLYGSQRDFDGSEIILKKCNGLPLALVNMAQLLKSSADQLTSTYCKDVCRRLGSHLQNEDLSRMNQVLNHSYDILPGHGLKTCLLSISIFPKDHQIKRKTLIRRWLAEGLVVKDVVAYDYFEKLIDQSIIQPVQTSNNVAVKSCQVQDIVLDFIVHKSDSKKFITFIHNNETRQDNENSTPRRLSVNTTAEAPGVGEIDLSRIRSLTIFGHVGDYIKFEKCKLLRVLDLKNCAKIKDSDIKKICKSKLLKYLSLQGTEVSKIPSEISKLQHLETLDIRETNVSILPIEVIELPWLTHLFGQFRLPPQLNEVSIGCKLHTFLSNKSRLQTLAGFVIDENRGIQQLLLISTLRKVKVWSKETPSRGSTELLISSLLGRFSSDNTIKSLSIDFGDKSIDFLDKLCPETPCSLNSVKLHGKLVKLPDFINSLHDLELHLSSTALSTECLSSLQKLKNLLYLKLVDDCPEFANDNFTIDSTGFPRLQRLCIQTPKLPKMKIQRGAMQRLISLRLLCKDISGFSIEDIGHLKYLKEVTLYEDFVNLETRKDWDKEAKQHKNRPEIIYQPSEIFKTQRIW
ncbi:hypothetical protein ACP4OV_002349 [Aristida adscensionis]